jgi:hypothetical protein
MILSKEIVVKVSNKNLKYYKQYFPFIISGDNININVNLLSSGSKQKIKVKCDICGHEKEMMYKVYRKITNNITDKYYCKECKSIKTKETVQNKYGVKNVFQLEEIKILSKNTCNKKYNVSYYSQTEQCKETVKKTNFKNFGVNYPLQSDKIKSKINYIQTPEKINKMIKTTRNNYSKIFIDKSNLIHNGKYDYSNGEYINMYTKIIIKCPFHGFFKQRPMDHINSKQGCPICSESKGEKEIMKYLKIHNIEYVSQKTFEGCKNKKLLHFDFYLSEYNICIEYDGEQHFRSCEIFGGEEKFKKLKFLDNIKNEFCEKNKILLLRIKYTDNIEDVLDKKLLLS